MTLYVENVDVGWSGTYGNHTMEREAMLPFAERFDPQPMYVDPESVHGDGIASGVHTIGVATRLLVDGFPEDVWNVGGLGIDDPRFHEPVDRGTPSRSTTRSSTRAARSRIPEPASSPGRWRSCA